jgi:hypothetical protein
MIEKENRRFLVEHYLPESPQFAAVLRNSPFLNPARLQSKRLMSPRQVMAVGYYARTLQYVHQYPPSEAGMIPLQAHNLEVIEALSRSHLSPKKAAEARVDYVTREWPRYLTANPLYRKTRIAAYVTSIRAYRRKKVVEIPDGHADVLCTHCYNFGGCRGKGSDILPVIRAVRFQTSTRDWPELGIHWLGRQAPLFQGQASRPARLARAVTNFFGGG